MRRPAKRWYVRCIETDQIDSWFWTRRGAESWARSLNSVSFVHWVKQMRGIPTPANPLRFMVGQRRSI